MRLYGLLSVLIFVFPAMALSTTARAEPQFVYVRGMSVKLPSVPSCSHTEQGCYEKMNHFVADTTKYLEVCTLSYDIMFLCHQHFLSMDQQLERQQRDKAGKGPLHDGSVLNYLRIIRHNLDAVYVSRYQNRLKE